MTLNWVEQLLKDFFEKSADIKEDEQAEFVKKYANSISAGLLSSMNSLVGSVQTSSIKTLFALWLYDFLNTWEDEDSRDKLAGLLSEEISCLEADVNSECRSLLGEYEKKVQNFFSSENDE